MSRRAITSEQEPELAAKYAAGATYRELAEQYGCSDVAIRSALRRSGAALRTRLETLRMRSPWGPEVEDETIQKYRDGWSIRQLSKHWGVRTSEISDLLARRQEPLHPGGKAHPRFRSIQQCEEVAELYRTGKSLGQVAKAFNCSTPTVANALRRVGIELETGRRTFWTEERRNWVTQEYLAGRTQQSIADELGVHQTAISGRLRQAGVIKPQPKPTGPDHPSWTGGRTMRAPGGYVWVTPLEDDLLYCTPTSNGYVLEHRLVMGRALGRKLLPSETVHHINGRQSDNRLENLQLRQGKHGTGIVMVCNACGSHDVQATEIAS